MAYTGQLDGPKGDKGDKGDPGEPGPKGDPFTYEDFTPEQLANLVGPKGDKGDPGPKGDAFTYNDFTEEQLAALKGPKGDPGVDGSIVTVSATGTSEEEVQYITIDGVEKKLAGGGSKDALLYTEQVLTDEQKVQARKNQDLPYITYEETTLVDSKQFSNGSSAQNLYIYFTTNPYPDFSDFVKGQRFKIRVFDKDGTSGLDEICEYEMTSSTGFKSISDTTDFIYFESETNGYVASKNYIRFKKKDTSSAGLSANLYYSIIYDKTIYNSKLNKKLVDSILLDNFDCKPIGTPYKGAFISGKNQIKDGYTGTNILGFLTNEKPIAAASSNIFGYGNQVSNKTNQTVNIIGTNNKFYSSLILTNIIGKGIQTSTSEDLSNITVIGTYNNSLHNSPLPAKFDYNTTYSTGDLVLYDSSTARIYKSLINDNKNHWPKDGSTNDYWEFVSNVFDTCKLFVLANGTSDDNKSNALAIDKSGNADFSGTVASQGADYAEYFEWADGNVNDEDRVGYIVELDGDKIKLANQYTEDVLGIISAMPTVLGDTAALEWHGKYVKDKWGRIQYAIQDFIEEQQTVDEDGNPITEEVTISKLAPVINPDYDPDKAYYNRRSRKEWSTVGMLGKLYVRDDGTAEVNGYVKPAQGGIATKAAGKTNMRVLERVDENTIRVLLK